MQNDQIQVAGVAVVSFAVAVGAVGAAAAYSATREPSPPPAPEPEAPPTPPPAPTSYIAAREAVQEAAWGVEEEAEAEPEYEAVCFSFLVDVFCR